ncbi:MAG: hypothetical protein GF411_06105 [Candidatus Lokiarchaeota archaeon]|nr:hypothetical protein [Candidatus Lokiarchaeota archaeon]
MTDTIESLRERIRTLEHQHKTYTDLQLVYLPILMDDIKSENLLQIEKHGIQTKTLEEWVTFTVEELGEVARAVTDHKYKNKPISAIYWEAISTATLCLKIAEMAHTANEINGDT